MNTYNFTMKLYLLSLALHTMCECVGSAKHGLIDNQAHRWPVTWRDTRAARSYAAATPMALDNFALTSGLRCAREDLIISKRMDRPVAADAATAADDDDDDVMAGLAAAVRMGMLYDKCYMTIRWVLYIICTTPCNVNGRKWLPIILLFMQS